MEKCQFCGKPLPHHEDACRIHGDMDLFYRVYLRLSSEDRNLELQGNLARHLMRHGRLHAAQ